MRSLLAVFLAHVKMYLQSEVLENVKLVDMGCGTGRNTLQLISTIASSGADSVFRNTQIVGLDASNGMLDVARKAIQKTQPSTRRTTEAAANTPTVTLAQFDLLTQSPTETLDLARNADGIISTLVLEHIPLDVYFASAALLLRSGAYLLVTNMHADMGRISQAGFIDPETGKKVRPTRSYAHEITDVVAEATRAGFEIVPLQAAPGRTIDGMIERTVTVDLVGSLGKKVS